MTTVVERAAEVLFEYNTSAGLHFVIHDGGYEGMAQALLEAGLLKNEVQYEMGQQVRTRVKRIVGRRIVEDWL